MYIVLKGIVSHPALNLMASRHVAFSSVLRNDLAVMGHNTRQQLVGVLLAPLHISPYCFILHYVRQ